MIRKLVNLKMFLLNLTAMKYLTIPNSGPDLDFHAPIPFNKI